MFVYIQTINYMFLISYVYKLDLFDVAAHTIFFLMIVSLNNYPLYLTMVGASLRTLQPPGSSWGIILDVLLFVFVASLNHLDFSISCLFFVKGNTRQFSKEF